MTTNSLQLTKPELDQILDATDAAAGTSLSRIYTALGHMLNAINVTLESDPELRDELQQHLVVIDEESRGLKQSVHTLTAEMTALAAFAEEIRNQRTDALFEIRDLSSALESKEHDVQSRLYMDMLNNIQVHFDCSRKVANKLLDAIWDINEPIASRTAEMIESIAYVINERENGY